MYWPDRYHGNLGIRFSSTNVNPPNCAAFEIGKQERTPKGNSRTDNHDGGSIKVNHLKPGDLIFSYQYDSRLEGRHFNA